MLRAMLRLARDIYIYLTFRYPTFGCAQFRGVYENFQQAKAAVPRKQKIGYNHADLARAHQAELTLQLDSAEYPVLFHLDRILREHCTVLDFGGNIGVHYLHYRQYLNVENIKESRQNNLSDVLSPIFAVSSTSNERWIGCYGEPPKWIVCDLPEITKAGRETCAGMSNVAFINTIAELKESRIDILLACGSLQYVASPALLLQALIAKGMRPAHILIDALLLYDGPRFVTLQNGGLVYYPQYVFNYEEYMAAIANVGYELVDLWSVKQQSCIIPFHPDKLVNAYKGFRFSDKRTSQEMG